MVDKNQYIQRLRDLTEQKLLNEQLMAGDMQPADVDGRPVILPKGKDTPSLTPAPKPERDVKPIRHPWQPEGWLFVRAFTIGGVTYYIFVDSEGNMHYVSDNNGDGYPDFYHPWDPWRDFYGPSQPWEDTPWGSQENPLEL